MASVLIDASVVCVQMDGLSQYVVNLLRHLHPSSRPGWTFAVLLTPMWADTPLAQELSGQGYRLLFAPMAAAGPKRDWLMARFLRAHAGQFDVIHWTSNQYPLAGRGGVYTVHDVIYRRWPLITGRGAWAKKAYQNQVIRHGLHCAALVIAVSQDTAAQMRQEFTDACPASVTVIGEGWEHVQEYADAVTDKGPNGPYLFYLGSTRGHKNLSGLLAGFAGAAAQIPELSLVITGRGDRWTDAQQRLVATLNAEGPEHVRLTGHLPAADAYALLRDAAAFVFPSYSEGFGIPLLEAFALGVPVLCARAAALPEVAGDAALYFDPADPADMTRQMTALLGDAALQRDLIEKGQARLSVFSWQKCADETFQVYRAALERTAGK